MGANAGTAAGRSGLYDAASARDALARCLAQLGDHPADHQDAAPDAELADLWRDQQQLRDALVEPDVSFIVTPVAAEAHFVRDHDGVVKLAAEVVVVVGVASSVEWSPRGVTSQIEALSGALY